MNKIHLIGTAVIAGVMVVGCGKDEGTAAPQAESTAQTEPSVPAVVESSGDPEEILVTVAGVVLKRGQLDRDVAMVLASQGDRIPTNQLSFAKQMFREQIARSFLFENALEAKARKLGIAVSEADRKAREADFVKAMAGRPGAPATLEEFFEKYPFGKDRARAEFERGLLIDKMVKAEVAKIGDDFAAEAEKVIADAKASDEAAAKKIGELKAQLDDPACKDVAATFATLAEANSDCPSGKRDRGSLGAFGRGQMVKEFDEAAFSLPVGKVSDVVKTQFGYHLILVTEKTPAVEAKDGQPAVEAKVTASHILVKSEPVPEKDVLINHLRQQKEREITRSFMETAVREAAPKVSDEFKQLLPSEETPAAAAE